MLENLYRTVVMEHAKHRKNVGILSGEDVHKVYYKNPTCGDVITLYIKVKEDAIRDVSFEGEGCSISMASSSMMTELIKNEDLEKVKSKRLAFEKLIREGKETQDQDLGEALALEGVHKLRARHNCALMAWQALDKVLENAYNYNFS
ncbi:Fe-S cluster assembly sulfur transfer protein SufU [Alteribacillus sp. HJP-4]|uniref:Fe-S cluster assembly sulfur transfer protein SufU n=1 Tax=Alteribacillus sp. HJP-4 TaxID=2775394 RepID=UPI0035CD3778